MNMSLPQSVETLNHQNLGETLKMPDNEKTQEEDDMKFIDQTLLNYESEKRNHIKINKQTTKFSI